MGGISKAVGGVLGDVTGGLVGGIGAGLTAKDNFNAAPIAAPTTVQQAKEAYDQAQAALAQQNSFVQALQGQNGIANQSAVYNQLQGVANGTGPNPAQAALNQATQQNVANQAALMAGQRGASQNAGLIARQAALQGGNLQQQAIGQGATLQAQQQLAGLNSLSGLATQQVGQQANALQGYNQAAQNEQSNILGGIANQNDAQNKQSSINAGVASENATNTNKMTGGLLNAGGAAAGMAHGGLIQKMADGGMAMNSFGLGVTPQQQAPAFGLGSAPSFGAPQAPVAPLPGLGVNTSMASDADHPILAFMKGSDLVDQANADAKKPGSSKVSSFHAFDDFTGSAKGGFAAGGSVNGEMMAAQGKMVPGKAKYKGDTTKNDIVPAVLSPGEIVIPRSVAQHPDAPKKAAEFVAAVLAKNGKGMKRK